MPRPRRCRRVCFNPNYRFFKPQGTPTTHLQKIDLDLDELEALRLTDMNDLQQLEAASHMNVSQSTYNRILKSARGKVTRAIVEGCALRIRDDARNEAIKLSSRGCVDRVTGRDTH